MAAFISSAVIASRSSGAMVVSHPSVNDTKKPDSSDTTYPVGCMSEDSIDEISARTASALAEVSTVPPAEIS